MYQYRPYQQNLHDRTFTAWDQGSKNVLLVSDVGSGKTVLISNIVREIERLAPGKSIVVIAHRVELVSQISLSLAENGLDHRLIASSTSKRFITKRHVKKFKRSYINLRSPVVVSSVGTLVNDKTINPDNVALWVVDEAHHVLKSNQWGKCVTKYHKARGLGVTATPCRADGKGLGSHNDGVFDEMLVNEMSMGDLILAGNLTRFKIYAPPSDIDLRQVSITASGDFSKNKLHAATLDSHIVGDVVAHYKKLAMGKLGVTFVPDVEIGELIAKQFNDNGVPAALIHAKTPDTERARLLDQFENREILQLVNVDIFGEGFNLPAIEVVSFARATASYGLYVQQFGRALRTLEGKDHAIIIDHVGNVVRHGLPTQSKNWSLERREKRSSSKDDPDKLKLKACKECTGVYEAFHHSCPYCGYQHIPEGATSPEMVEGDLVLMDFTYIDDLHKKIAKLDRELGPADLPNAAGRIAVNAVKKNHRERQEAQTDLRHAMAVWSGVHMHHGLDLRQRQKLFYLRFNVDILTAQTLNKKDTLELLERVENDTKRVINMG
jgi:DNA repair protein RadD